jgi:hypothetical protein
MPPRAMSVAAMTRAPPAGADEGSDGKSPACPALRMLDLKDRMPEGAQPPGRAGAPRRKLAVRHPRRRRVAARGGRWRKGGFRENSPRDVPSVSRRLFSRASGAAWPIVAAGGGSLMRCQ